MEITKSHKIIIEFLKNRIYPWRKLTIGIDGLDGSGKSTLARFISWQLGIPTIETDLLLISDPSTIELHYEYEILRKLIDARHSLNRPVIVEGIVLLETLERINIETDILVYVKEKGNEGSYSLRNRFKEYQENYKPERKTNYTYIWVSSESDKMIQS